MNAVDHEYDTPSMPELNQGEDPEPVVIPVKLVNAARVDQLPLRGGATGTWNLVGVTNPIKILDENVKRSAITLDAVTADVFVAFSQAECMRDESRYRIKAASGAQKFHFINELWAVNADADGSDAAALTVLTEDWAR